MSKNLSRRDFLELSRLAVTERIVSPLLSLESRINGEDTDGKIFIEGIGFLANFSKFPNLEDSKFYQQSSGERLVVRARQVKENGNIGNFVSSPTLIDPTYGRQTFDVGLSNIPSGKIIFEAGRIGSAGVFKIAPYVSQQVILQAALADSETPVLMHTTIQEVDIDEQTYYIPRQIINVDELDQPNDKGFASLYTDFVYWNLPEDHQMQALSEYALGMEQNPPKQDLLQIMGITKGPEKYYQLMLRTQLKLSGIDINEEELLQIGFSDQHNIWHFDDAEELTKAIHHLAGKFLCLPTSHYVYDNGRFLYLDRDPARPLQIPIRYLNPGLRMVPTIATTFEPPPKPPVIYKERKERTPKPEVIAPPAPPPEPEPQ